MAGKRSVLAIARTLPDVSRVEARCLVAELKDGDPIFATTLHWARLPVTGIPRHGLMWTFEHPSQ